ncbi:hypothetical protein [Streptomyces sp. NPDC089799]|uniref:outer membrane protein assembly factor BamB family protein n=1 Tax=Streptomyces sp. NPDC089799 TaxID=3155066 RepID=UPI003424FD0F
MSDLSVALHRTSAYIATSEELQTVDLTTGEVRATARPRGSAKSSDVTKPVAPLVVAGAGSTSVLAPFLVTEAGSGTQSASTVLDVVSVSAQSGEEEWHTTIRLPQWAHTGLRVQPAVVAAGDGVVVVTVKSAYEVVSYGIDLATHQLRWTAPGVTAGAVAAGSAVGWATEGQYSAAVGLALTDGKEKWRGTPSWNVDLDPAGPSVVRTYAQGTSGGKGYDRLVKADTGEEVADLSGAGLRGARCSHDASETLVCSNGSVITGIDTTTGRVLWTLKDGQEDGRNAPEISSVWHGRVYAKSENGPVALDARTGRDVPTRPEAAPVLVNEFGGLVLDNGLQSYPAGG